MAFSSLKDKHIVITGASRGIGRALAYECARRGAHLTICARSEAEITQVGTETSAVAGVVDVCNPDAVEAWIGMGTGHFGPIHALINNAALLGPKCELKDYPLDQWQQVMAVNTTGIFVVTKAALPFMVRPGGVMAHMTSFLGRNAIPRFGAYCASKFAVEGFARLVAEEHAAEGLISFASDPGMVQTDMLVAAAETDEVSEHPTTEQAGVAFADLIQSAEPEASGTTQYLFGRPE